MYALHVLQIVFMQQGEIISLYGVCRMLNYSCHRHCGYEICSM